MVICPLVICLRAVPSKGARWWRGVGVRERRLIRRSVLSSALG